MSDAIDDYYRCDYRLDYKRAIEPRRAQIWRAGCVALVRWAEMRGHLSPGARLLDVGSGGGEWLYLLQKKAFQAVGIEPNEGYARYSQREYGVEVVIGSWLGAKWAEASFDAVTIHHALEHMDDPRALVRQAAFWLRPRGVLAIEVPNVEATCWAPNHRFHRAHLYAFNPATLEALVRRTGFEVISTRVSDGAGTISSLFLKDRFTPGREGEVLDANAERVTSILRRHTFLAHYLSRHPYTRPLARLARTVSEHWAVAGRRNGKEILEACFRSGKEEGAA